MIRAKYLLLLLFFSTVLQAQIIYVDASKTNLLPDGSSWANSYNNLQQAIDDAKTKVNPEIWVAEGTYLPSKDISGQANANPRKHTFFIDFNVKIYGGFAGWESDLKDRDWYNNRTILSGDFNGDDKPFDTTNNGENAYTVLYLAGLSSDAKISGFYIERGHGNPNTTSFSLDARGAGLVTDDNGAPCTPHIEDCHFRYNVAAQHGGAVYNHGEGGNASPIFTRCIFTNNYAKIHGGAMVNNGFGSNSSASPTFYHCLFAKNHAEASGGAIYFDGGNNGFSPATIFNCTFADNKADAQGGALRLHDNSSVPNFIINCIFWNNAGTLQADDIYLSTTATLFLNYSIFSPGGLVIVEGATVNQTGNSNTDPMFTNFKNYRLQQNSPGINHGDPTFVSAGSDLDGNLRIFGGTIDAGAYEFLTCTLDTLYVDQSIENPGEGYTWQTAHRDITMALQQAHNADFPVTILIAAGIYTPTRSRGEITNYTRYNAYLIENISVNLKGGFQPASKRINSFDMPKHDPNIFKTILTGDRRRDDGDQLNTNKEENHYTILFADDAFLSISNCTIEKSYGDGEVGGGIRISNELSNASTLLVEDCIFNQNRNSYEGGAIRSNGNNTNISVFRSEFLNNQARNGGAISADLAFLSYCLFHKNEALITGGAIYGNFSDIENCSFTDNRITSPLGFSGSAIYINTTDTILLSNNILHNNGPTDALDCAPTGRIIVQHCMLEDNPFGLTNVFNIGGVLLGVNPGFLGPNNFRLSDTSAAIDAGKELYVSFDLLLDLDHNRANRYGSSVDMGCYEFLSCTPDQNIYVDQNIQEVGGGSGWSTAHRELADALRQACHCSGATTIHIAEGTYLPRYDSSFSISDTRAKFIIKDIKGDLNILGGYQTGGSARDPALYPTYLSSDLYGNDIYQDVIHENLEENLSNYLLLAKDSTLRFYPRVIFRGLNFRGGHNRPRTDHSIIISKMGVVFKNCLLENTRSRTMIKVDTASISMDSCIVQNNFTFLASILFSGDTSIRRFSISSSTFLNNFTGSTCFSFPEGLKIYAVLKNTHFLNNSGSYEFLSSPFRLNSEKVLNIDQCVFGNNSSRESFLRAEFDSIKIRQNTFFQTKCPRFLEFEGGHYVEISNTVLWNSSDTPQQSLGAIEGSTRPLIKYCLLNGFAINSDFNIGPGMKYGIYPQFLDSANFDLRVATSSPLANAGENISSPQSTDIDGHHRFLAGTTDLGAYEGAENNCQTELTISPVFYQGIEILSGVWKAEQKINVFGDLKTMEGMHLVLDAPEVEFFSGNVYSTDLDATLEILQDGCYVESE